MPWATVRRLALAGGLFPPSSETIDRAGLAGLLRRAAARADLEPRDRRELAALLAWLEPRPDAATREGAAAGRAGGCGGWRTGTRLRLDARGLGDAVAGEAGLGLPAGMSLAVEPHLEAWRGPLWLAVTPRLAGRVLAGGDRPPDALLYPDWPVATGLPVVGGVRRGEAAWRLRWPLAVAGLRLGSWSLSAGLAPRREGPGLGDALVLDRQAPSFPAATLRRTEPFRWRGLLGPLSPSALLVRAGLVSERRITFETDAEPPRSRRDRPWFLQWLLGWEPASWLRTTFVHAAMATSRAGTLWPDLLQVGFPLLSATWNETTRGPVTDRIFAVQLEARWRDAPWPLLPARAGRAWWEYAGEDFLPDERLGFLPQLSAPASVAGVELLGRRWDLAVQYAELEHPTVLWYAHAELGDGWTQRGWPLGDRLGGGGESVSALVRWRPGRAGWQAELSGARAGWGPAATLPGEARRWRGRLAVGRPAARLAWELSVEIVREWARGTDGPRRERTWPAAGLLLQLR